MNEVPNDIPANSQVRKAIALIAKLCQQHSFAKVAAMLNNYESYEHVDKGTLHRWIHYQPDAASHDRTKARIVQAAGHLARHKAPRFSIRFVIIDKATEMLPALLLQRYPEWSAALGAKVDLEKVDLIEDAINALENEKVHVALAPRDTEQLGRCRDVRRFLEVATIQISGTFPLKWHDDRQFAVDLQKKSLTVGYLPNADYRNILRKFMTANGAQMPGTRKVLSHNEALRALRRREIDSVFGHAVFVSNFQQAVEEAKRSGERFGEIDELTVVPNTVFGTLKMDAFVNVKSTPAASARGAMYLLNKCIDKMKYGIDSELIKNINTVLGLEPDDEISGRQLLAMRPRPFEIASLETETVLALWKF